MCGLQCPLIMRDLTYQFFFLLGATLFYISFQSHLMSQHGPISLTLTIVKLLRRGLSPPNSLVLISNMRLFLLLIFDILCSVASLVNLHGGQDYN